MSYEGVGGGGRLCGAVQRVMAMRTRERRSSQAQAVEGIGAMRELFPASPVNLPPNAQSSRCWRCGGAIGSNVQYWEAAEARIGSLGGMGTQSMSYSRFCGEAEDVNVGASAVGSHEMCEGCWDSQVTDATPTENVKRKGLFARLACRHLLRLHKKLSPPPALRE